MRSRRRARVRCPRPRPSRPRSRRGRSPPASARRERRTAAMSRAPGRPAPGGRSDGGRRLARRRCGRPRAGVRECTPITTSRSPNRSSSGRNSSMTRMQLMQQNVQKSSTTTRPRRSRNASGRSVFSRTGTPELRVADTPECGGHARSIIPRRHPAPPSRVVALSRRGPRSRPRASVPGHWYNRCRGGLVHRPNSTGGSAAGKSTLF